MFQYILLNDIYGFFSWKLREKRQKWFNIKETSIACLHLSLYVFLSVVMPSSNFRTPINASCGTSTVPNWRYVFTFFCFPAFPFTTDITAIIFGKIFGKFLLFHAHTFPPIQFNELQTILRIYNQPFSAACISLSLVNNKLNASTTLRWASYPALLKSLFAYPIIS